jgi:iron complex outermembrane receptor protein
MLCGLMRGVNSGASHSCNTQAALQPFIFYWIVLPMPISTRPFRLTTLLAAMSGIPAVSFAQSLPEVVVSASRSEQRSFDVPAAVQAVNGDEIQRAGPQVNLSESLVRVPGLTILDRGNYAQDLQVSIRGFGARSAFGIRGIRLLIDGIPATTPDGQGQGSSISLTSMERIEVLRGPLAQLYGNSAGGVIQAFTKPASQDPQVDYQYYMGSYGLRRADYQFSDTVGGYGIVADYSTFSTDGYRDNSQAERKQFNGKLSFDANEKTRVNVVFNQFDMPLAQDPLGLTRAQLDSDPTQAGTGALANSTRKTVLQNQLGSSITYALDKDRSLTGRAYYGTRENLQFLASGNWVGLDRSYYGLGLQYNERTTVGHMPLEWAAGYEFDRSTENRQAGGALAGEKNGPLTRLEDNQSENSDFFVQGTALVSERVSVVAGLRASSVRFVSDDEFITPTNPDGSGSVSYSATSPVLGVTYHASEQVNLYANYGQGFETPTLAEVAYSVATPLVARFNPTLSASTSKHYEIGAKWVPSRDSRVDFALYQINTTDEIVVAASQFGQSAYKNAPGTTRRGFELSGNTLLTPTISARLSASMIDAKYSQTFLSGVTTVNAGNKLPGIPQTSVFSELAWTSEAAQARKGAAAMGTRLSVELVHAGRIYANDTNTASADGHTVFNLAAMQRWPLGKGAITLYGRVNNVSDKSYVGSVIVNQGASQFYEPGLPRNWTAGVSVTMPL